MSPRFVIGNRVYDGTADFILRYMRQQRCGFNHVAELFISPLGLSFVSKVAPKHLQGLCQGLWLCATAVGNLLLWIGPLIYNAYPIWVAWTVFFSVCIISMGVMLGMVKWLERVTE